MKVKLITWHDRDELAIKYQQWLDENKEIFIVSVNYACQPAYDRFSASHSILITYNIL